MPTSVQPVIRSLQEAEESNGLIQTRDSTLVTIYKAQESAGTRTKVVPKEILVLRGTQYIPA